MISMNGITDDGAGDDEDVSLVCQSSNSSSRVSFILLAII